VTRAGTRSLRMSDNGEPFAEATRGNNVRVRETVPVGFIGSRPIGITRPPRAVHGPFS